MKDIGSMATENKVAGEILVVRVCFYDFVASGSGENRAARDRPSADSHVDMVTSKRSAHSKGNRE